jgi:X-Pro dipeptidyl-peptidase
VTVKPATREPAVPTGTVQASSGGAPLGPPVALAGGTATIPVTRTAGPIVVTYSGDRLYNAGSATVAYAATSASGTAAGAVAPTLSLSLGAPASLGALVPGRDATYSAQTTADVISTAGDATLGVSDPGHLTNGAFALADPLQVSLSKSSWTAPVTHDPVTIGFSQHIGANEPLRTGSYTRTLTFTLSTATP